MDKQGLLILAPPRYFETAAYSPPQRLPAGGLMVGEILERYGGFEGELWPGTSPPSELQRGLLPVARLTSAIDCLARCSPVGCRLIHMDSAGDESLVVPPGFRLLGYDLGTFESEHNYFSVIFHDILFGKHDGLRALTVMLNDRLLLPSVFTARRLAAIREELRSGADLEGLEEDGGAVPIAIAQYGATDP